MKPKRLGFVVVIIGVVVALGVEFWTFGEMIWQGLAGKPDQQETKVQKNSDRFEIDQLQGQFKDLSVVIRDSTWHFYCKMNLENTSNITRSIGIEKIRFKNNDTIDVRRKVKILPKRDKTIHFSVDIQQANTPTEMGVNKTSGTNSLIWVTFPRIPVQKSN